MSTTGKLVQWIIHEPIPDAFSEPVRRARQHFDSDDADALQNAIARWEDIVSSSGFESAPTLFQVATLIWSGFLFWLTYSIAHRLEDLCAALERYSMAAHRAPADFPFFGALYAVIGETFKAKYDAGSAIPDLDRALAAYQQAASHTPATCPDTPNLMAALASALLARYEKIQDPADLDRAVAATEQALVGAESDPAVLEKRLDLAVNCLTARYEAIGNDVDIDRAVAAVERGRDRTSERVCTIGAALYRSYVRRGAPMDLDRAIDMLRNCVASAPVSALPDALNNLAVALHERFDRSGCVSDIEDSIAAASRGISLSPQDPVLLNTLGSAYFGRHNTSSSPDDLEKSIEQLRRAVELTPSNSPDVARRLHNLGVVLLHRYEQTDQAEDLDTMIRVCQSAVDRAAEGPELARCLRSLGTAIRARYRRERHMSDLRSAINLQQRALELIPAGCKGRTACLLSLGNSFADLYERTDESEWLEKALCCYREAYDAIPPESSGKIPVTDALANALINRYVSLRDADVEAPISDLNAAIDLLEALLPRISPESSHFSSWLHTLCRAKLLRSERMQNTADLEKVIACSEQAVKATSTKSASTATHLTDLATALSDHWRLTHDPADCARATTAYRDACTLGLELNPQATIRAAFNWGCWAQNRVADGEANEAEIAEAYTAGIAAVRQLFRSQLLLEGKKTWLRDENVVFPARAAFALAACGDVRTAVVTLEQNRALLLSEFLQRDRARLESLDARGQGELSRRFRDATERLRELETVQRTESGEDTDIDPGTLLERLRSAKTDFNSVVADIRALPGFARFLELPSFDDIRAAASDQPLIYLIPAPSAGLALVVWPERVGKPHPLWQGVTPVFLPDLDEMTVLQVECIGRPEDHVPWGHIFAQYCWQTDRNKLRDWKIWIDTLHGTTQWLWQAAMDPLIKLLSAVGERKAVLIPQGFLTFVPFHAAWVEHEGAPTGRRYALDELTISYAPCALALESAKRISHLSLADSLLGIADPRPSEQIPLVHAQEELKIAASHFRQVRLLLGEDATFENVRAKLAAHPLLHFACHVETDDDDPLDSGFILAHDRRFTLRELLQAQLQARLAILSACGSGITDMDLPDEAVSIPAGFIQAGVGGIVMTLWAVPDISSMLLVSRFYDLWRDEGREPAEALQGAQRWLRDTQNADLIAYAARQIPDLNTGPGTEWEHLTSHPSERAFSDPMYWAAFAYMGA